MKKITASWDFVGSPRFTSRLQLYLWESHEKRNLPTTLSDASLHFAAGIAQAQEGYRFFGAGLWENRLSTEYFTTDSNYFTNGQTAKLPNSGTFALTSVAFQSRYVLNSHWAFFAGLDGADAEAKSSVYGSHSLMGATGARVGGQFRLGLAGIDLIPEVSYFNPFQTPSINQANAIAVEGVTESLVKLGVQTRLPQIRLYGFAGYMYRGGGRSTLVPWNVGAEIPFTSSVLGLHFYGSQSVSNDVDTGSSAEVNRNVTLLQVNAGSDRFFAVNPSIIDSEGYVTFNFNRHIAAGVGGGITLSGSNSAYGFHGEVTLTYRLATAPPRRTTPVTVDPYVDQFREDTTDGVDQRIFRKPAKPPLKKARPVPAAPAPVQDMPPMPEEMAPPRDAAAAEREQRRETKKQLDDAEVQIELKVDKKRRGN